MGIYMLRFFILFLFFLISFKMIKHMCYLILKLHNIENKTTIGPLHFSAFSVHEKVAE